MGVKLEQLEVGGSRGAKGENRLHRSWLMTAGQLSTHRSAGSCCREVRKATVGECKWNG